MQSFFQAVACVQRLCYKAEIGLIKEFLEIVWGGDMLVFLPQDSVG